MAASHESSKAVEEAVDFIFENYKNGKIFTIDGLKSEMKTISRRTAQDAIDFLRNEDLVTVSKTGTSLKAMYKGEEFAFAHGRMFLESGIACLIASNLVKDFGNKTDRKRRELSEIFDLHNEMNEIVESLEKGSNPDEASEIRRWLQLDNQWHWGLAQKADCESLIPLLRKLRNRLRVADPNPLRPHHLRENVSEHGEILSCIIYGDERKIRKAVEKHINRSVQRRELENNELK